jgi:hypothetical protein
MIYLQGTILRIEFKHDLIKNSPWYGASKDKPYPPPTYKFRSIGTYTCPMLTYHPKKNDFDICFRK